MSWGGGGGGEQTSFTLLDVPGIEGQEAKVRGQIEKALSQAHVIFYVNRNCSPEKETLAKIKSYLNDQSRVYFFFNKGAGSPESLQGSLVKDGEEHALKQADARIQEALGSCYQGHQVVRAQVAFLALAECLWKEDDFKEGEGYQFSHTWRTQQKFLKEYSTLELLKQSNLDVLCQLIKEIGDTQAEIIYQDRCHKASKILMACAGDLHQSAQAMLDKNNKLREQMPARISELRLLPKRMRAFLAREMSQALQGFKSASEDAVYGYIKLDVSDGEFREEANGVLERQFDKFSDVSTQKVKSRLQAFEEDVRAVMADFNHLAESVESGEVYLGHHHDQEFDTDTGIDWWKLGGAGATIGGLLMFDLLNFWNPAGWIGMGAAALLLYNATRKFFDSDFKKREQRKAFNKDLDEKIRYIEGRIKDFLENIEHELEGVVEKIIKNLEGVLIQREEGCKTLRNIAMSLDKRAGKLQLRGRR
ncbi:hypothetical protein [Helicobacter bizzozeronii]|uniref:hypothetical protein n=1 Tax=Helicobacter bizzozeronii TaxID=56877 RepID=UPI001F357628|nr:hypothetical protein [Helicobacter bizzozeronii]